MPYIVLTKKHLFPDTSRASFNN